MDGHRGKFQIVRDWGLRSIVQAAPARKNLTGEQAAFIFFGKLSEKSLRKKETAGEPGGGAGYSLSYRPGQPLELLSVSGRGARVIDRGLAPLTLEDKRAHFIEWTRRAEGRMAVSVDGDEVLSTQDRGFAGAFNGFRLVNRGGDFIVRSVSIEGTE